MQYNPGKANIVTDALSRSQPNSSVMEKQEMDVLKDDETGFFALSGTTMTTNVGELQNGLKHIMSTQDYVAWWRSCDNDEQ